MGRAPCCDKVGLKRGRWTAEEDEKLKKYIQENGEGSWRSLPKNAGLLRCGKSCRLRWINYLRTDLKRGSISTQEEEIIINLHASMGNRWSLIAAYLPGRTDNEIKNYWNSHLSRKIDSFRPNRHFIPPPPPPPPPPSKLGVSRKKNIKNSNRRGGGGPKQPEHQEVPAAAGEANAVVFMPTTPSPERESVGRVVTDSSQQEETTTTTTTTEEMSGSSMLGIDDINNIIEDLSGLWGPVLGEMEISRPEDFEPGNVYGETGSSNWESMSSEIHENGYENTFSWIWDDGDEKWNSDDQEMDDDAMLSWLLS